MTKDSVADVLPLVSIIIPARNEARHLPRVLTAIDALDYPATMREVILVDNGSEDDTAAIAQRSGARVIGAPGVNVGEVRNVGARAARGEVLAFVDADCLVGSRWLGAAVELLADARVGAVGGNCGVASDANWVQRAWVAEQHEGVREATALATASFILRRRTFEEVGGFDASLGAGEDDDLSGRLRAIGYRLTSAADCSVVHLGYPPTLGGILRRQLWHGRSQLHGSVLDPMALLTHLFAVLVLGLIPAGLLLGISSLAGAGLFGSIAAASLPALRKEWRGGGIAPLRLVQRVVVYWWFLLGRSLGLVLNYGDRIARAWRPLRMERGA